MTVGQNSSLKRHTKRGFRNAIASAVEHDDGVVDLVPYPTRGPSFGKLSNAKPSFEAIALHLETLAFSMLDEENRLDFIGRSADAETVAQWRHVVRTIAALAFTCGAGQT